MCLSVSMVKETQGKPDIISEHHCVCPEVALDELRDTSDARRAHVERNSGTNLAKSPRRQQVGRQ